MIETPRLILRGWRDADYEPFAALNADPEVMRHFPATHSRECAPIEPRLRLRPASPHKVGPSFLKDLAPLPGRNIRAGFTYEF